MKQQVERWGVIEERKFATTYTTEVEAREHLRVRLGESFRGYIVKLTGEYERKDA